MRRCLVLLLLSACLFLQGCIGALIGAALAPRQSAASLGSNAAYNVSRSLAGADLGEVVSQADTLANLDQILKEHPDAANRGELERLRSRIAQDLEAPVDDDALNTADLALQDGHQMGQPEPVQRSGYDRRSEGRERDPFAQVIAGRPQAEPLMRSSLSFEERDHPDQRLRSRDPWRVSAVPRASELSSYEPGWSIITLGGATQHIDSTGRR